MIVIALFAYGNGLIAQLLLMAFKTRHTQCMYNVGRVCVTIVAVENQQVLYILSVCVCV
jgi:hypothetical protein